MREAVGNYGKNLAVLRRICACWCGARICVLLGPSWIAMRPRCCLRWLCSLCSWIRSVGWLPLYG